MLQKDSMDSLWLNEAIALQWCHNELDGISNHQFHHCLLNRFVRHRSKQTSKLCITDLCEGNSPVTSEFSAQMASNTENVSIWWHHHGASENMVNIWSGKYLLPDTIKPLLEPMLTNDQWHTVKFAYEQFLMKCVWYLSLIWFWKILI